MCQQKCQFLNFPNMAARCRRVYSVDVNHEHAHTEITKKKEKKEDIPCSI